MFGLLTFMSHCLDIPVFSVLVFRSFRVDACVDISVFSGPVLMLSVFGDLVVLTLTEERQS